MTRSLIPWGIPAPSLFGNFRREMDRLLDECFVAEDGGEMLRVFAPRTNVAETEKEYEITLDLPGLKPEDFNVELNEGRLWISGERKHEAEEKDKTYHRIERHYGQFRRVIPLETAVNAEKIEAEYRDGVLRITVPKDEALLPRRIEVKS
jgi:HSP20 family protein